MSDLPTVLLVDDEPSVRKLVAMLLRDRYKVVGEASNGHECLQLVADTHPDLVLMDLDMPVLGGLEATQKILASHPSTSVVMASGQSDIKSLKKAMAAGAREYLIKPFDQVELLECLDRIIAAATAREAATQMEEKAPGAGTWTFLGAGTGEGRTTLVIGLAADLIRRGHSVCILDADLLFGDVAFYLGVDATSPDLLDLFASEQYLEAAVIEKHLKTHESGIQILTGSSNPAGLLDLDYTQVPPLAQALEDLFDYVLVDVPFGVDEALVGTLDHSRFVFPVASMQPSQLKNLKVMYGILGKLGYSASKLRPVLTGSEEKAARAWIERVQINVARVFPSDPDSANEAIRRGQPVTVAAPQGPLALAICDFIAPLLRIPRTPAKPAEEKSLLSRLLG